MKKHDNQFEDMLDAELQIVDEQLAQVMHRTLEPQDALSARIYDATAEQVLEHAEMPDLQLAMQVHAPQGLADRVFAATRHELKEMQTVQAAPAVAGRIGFGWTRWAAAASLLLVMSISVVMLRDGGASLTTQGDMDIVKIGAELQELAQLQASQSELMIPLPRSMSQSIALSMQVAQVEMKLRRAQLGEVLEEDTNYAGAGGMNNLNGVGGDLFDDDFDYEVY